MPVSSHIEAPADFTKNVMASLPKKKTTSKWKFQLRKHPLMTAAAVFFLLMTASVFSMWFDKQEGISVSGPGNVTSAIRLVSSGDMFEHIWVSTERADMM